jgi:quercetin dioxygenase-like cupin family protein
MTAPPGDEPELRAPNGTRIERVEAEPALVLPPLRPSFVLTRFDDAPDRWDVGRAGMMYRDLIPGRQNGRFIASHIRIDEAGPVPDWVHYHRVRFQMIYCYRGEVEVAYEDQGEPFVLRAGDCVLQPPEIRHRVLRCSAGLEVIELSSPAVHETRADHELALPTGKGDPARRWSGQRFVRHVAADASWEPWRLPGFQARDTGIAAATDGLATVRVVRPKGPFESMPCTVDVELLFIFVLRGEGVLGRTGEAPEPLAAGDCVVIPAGIEHEVAECSEDLEILEVMLPGS